MKTLLMIIDASIACLGLTMGLVQAVVCILYGFVLDMSPALVKQLPMLLWSTVIFTVVGLAFLGVFFMLLRGRNWRWSAQGAVLISLAPAGILLTRLFA
jgi:multisubunit Na+/H+ antiporter MnhB subunit